MRMLGWKPDRPDARDFVFATSAHQRAPKAASLRESIGALILDQGMTQSCVAHALAYAVYVCHRRAGMVSPEIMSRLFAYWTARHRHGEHSVDGGTYLREGMKAIAKLGFCPEKAWPFEVSMVNVQPSWGAFREASDLRLGLAYYRIETRGAERVEAVRAAIAAGHPVVFGTEVGPGFLLDRTGPVFKPPRESVGGHAMCLVEYDELAFRGPQSWGPAAHGTGWFALAPEYIAWEGTRDLWVLRTAPGWAP